VIASIPSPSESVLELGPLDLRAYGVMIGLGVLAAVWLFSKRLESRGVNPDVGTTIAMVAVPLGLVGARAYHVITDWKSFQGRWIEAFYIWEGGLGILGGIAFGVAGSYWVARRHEVPMTTVLDAAAPAIPLAQAIGRWGNWWNQELFGKPSDLPWAIEIDPENRVAAYPDDATFHPTFLYESLWNLALVGFILWIDRRNVLRPGRVFAVYTGGYAAGRLWIEALRIDTASQVFGLRVNLWVFGVVLLASIAAIATGRRSPDELSSDAIAADEDDADLDDEPGDAGHDEPEAAAVGTPVDD